MSLTRSLTFNNITAAITVGTKLTSDNHLDWEITLSDENNTVSTNGLVVIEVAEPKPVTVAAVAIAEPKPVAVTSSTYPQDEKVKHVTVIKAMLNRQETLKGRENKAVNAIKILDYVSGEALDFTKVHDKFKNTVINKCYEFKQNNADMPEVVKKADETLIKLGASTTIPSDFKPYNCKECGGDHHTPDVLTSVFIKTVTPADKKTNEIIDAWLASQPPIVAPIAAPTPVAPKEDTSAIELALFAALAKKYNFKHAIENPKQYLGYFESAVNRNSKYVQGSTKAEKMTNYFTLCTDDGQRSTLMKKIFEKHSMIFSDAAMTLYNEWCNTYKPTGNRYQKMDEFATVHKALFTA
jgi:hypothetical protein